MKCSSIRSIRLIYILTQIIHGEHLSPSVTNKQIITRQCLYQKVIGWKSNRKYSCLQTIHCSERCGSDTIDVSSGPYILSSFGYPDNYPINLHCSWNVYAGKKCDVLVVFHDFKIEKNYDMFSIGSGFNYSLKISGEVYPERLSFFSEDVLIEFRSDHITTDRGFNLTLKGVQAGE